MKERVREREREKQTKRLKRGGREGTDLSAGGRKGRRHGENDKFS
jgi:hypothetical protein